MSGTEKIYFEILKKKIVEVIRGSEPGIPELIKDWKGNEIVLFQEDLASREGSRISEKWFYTHLKSENDKLPRIDMLDLLSRYAGYSGWNDFMAKNKEFLPKQVSGTTTKRKIRILPMLILLILLSIYAGSGLFPVTYNFCFIDANLRQPILGADIQVILLYPGESPVFTKANESGCFVLKTNQPQVSMVIKSPYYKTDTITRILNKKMKSEDVHLYTNDYALVIHYFSTSNVSDWKKRRSQLDNMIADNAQIYQVFEHGLAGMEIYNKQEFINKLTMPVSSLKNIEIIETIYSGQKISVLRFYQKEQ